MLSIAYPFSPFQRGEGGRRPDEGPTPQQPYRSLAPSPYPLPARGERESQRVTPFERGKNCLENAVEILLDFSVFKSQNAVAARDQERFTH